MFAMPPAHAGDEAAIRDLFATVERAVRGRDTATLIDSATADHVMVSKNGETVVGRAALATYLDKMIGRAPSIKSLESRMEMSPEIVRHGITAIAHGRSLDHYGFTDGLDLNLTTIWTATLVRDQDRWRIAAIHYSFDLFDNGLLDLARRGALVAGAGGSAAGFLAGLLLLRRRRPRCGRRGC
jgi:ketosteroid isomerase-like protein